ncbi:MAG: class I SAM-dependent methyltransferase [Candidatus Limnocylindrales bacterium]
MADLQFEPASSELIGRLLGSLDVEGKVPRAIESLGPVGGRDVVLLGDGRTRARQLEALGARVISMGDWAGRIDLPDDSADVIVSFWSGFRTASLEELREADRVLRHDGRLLVVHDYGRDDVSRLRGDLPEYGTWSRRNGWFLKNGFRIRVVHCFWTFDSLDAAGSFLVDTFGPLGSAVIETLKRPRLTYNIAIYHRQKGGRSAGVGAPGVTAG